MKTIYNLEVGDTYWIKFLTPSNELKPVEHGLGSSFSFDDYKNALASGVAFLTEEECQASINYDLALAKIKRRASELDTGDCQLFADIQYYHEEWQEGLHASDYEPEYQTSSKLVFKRYIAEQIIFELPEECKTVLEYNG